jgi:hypothetical protein
MRQREPFIAINMVANILQNNLFLSMKARLTAEHVFEGKLGRYLGSVLCVMRFLLGADGKSVCFISDYLLTFLYCQLFTTTSIEP